VGAVLGLLLAAGLLSLERALSRPRARAGPWSRWSRRRAELLRQAGFGRARPGALAVTEVVSGALLAVAVNALSGAGGLAAAGLVLGLLLPSAALRRAARRRTADRRALRPEVVESLASGVRAGLPCRRRWRRWGSAVRSRCGRRWRRSAPTTGRRAGPPRRWTGCGTGSPTRSGTGWWRPSGWPVRSAGPTSAPCCGRSRRSCARTPGPGPSWRRGRAGRSTPPGRGRGAPAGAAAARVPAGDRAGVRHPDRDGGARRGRAGLPAGVPGDGRDRTVAGRAAGAARC
jgi:hypothetical protein